METRLDLIGNAAHLVPLRSADAHLHGPAGGRTKEEAVDLAAHRRKVFGQRQTKFRNETFECLLVLRHNQKLGIVRIAKLLV